MLAGGISGAVFVWDLSTGKLVDRFPNQISNFRFENIAKYGEKFNYKTSIAFSPDSQVIASSNYDGTIELWNIHTGKLITKLRGHRMISAENSPSLLINSLSPITFLSFTPDGRNLISTGADGNVKVWGIVKKREFGLKDSLIRSSE